MKITNLAKVLYKLITEEKRADYFESFRLLNETYQESSELQALIKDQSLSHELKKQLFNRIFPELAVSESAFYANLISLLLEHGNLNFLFALYPYLEQLRLADLGFTDAEMRVSQSLNDSEQNRIRASFGEKVKLSFSSDSSLKAGFIFKTKDYILDCSLSGKLKKLYHRLLNAR